MKVRRISCRNKIKHRDMTGAIVACKKLKKENNLIAHPYKCKRCGLWHIGKPTFKDNPFDFWNNIFTQMSPVELSRLEIETKLERK